MIPGHYKSGILLLLLSAFILNGLGAQAQLNHSKIDGYRGIWFELNQKYAYGDKYSGGLGTYTAKHIPLAIYAPKAGKTFFVYGGTIDATQRHLLCMIGQYDHRTGMVSKPTIVHDKEGVDDPHDNPSIMIDQEGYVWVFVSGRGNRRPGFKYKSTAPYSIEQFHQVAEEVLTYPQIWNTKRGFLHLFTKYTGVRQLYFETSRDGSHWSDDQLLAAIPAQEHQKSGHYQVSYCHRNKWIGTFFNRHNDGHPDQRTDLYFTQTKNFGQTWTNARGTTLNIPLLERDNPALVIDYDAQQKNVYMKDMGYDHKNRPVCLYIRSNGHEPGPKNAPYEWCVTKWNGRDWDTRVITTSDHNYDMGSLFITGKTWRVVGPTGEGPQQFGVGGEISIWISTNAGNSWQLEKTITANSQYNHGYIRRPLQFQKPFCFFWADGHPHQFSPSKLYFGDFEGNVYELPYEMEEDWQMPKKVGGNR